MVGKRIIAYLIDFLIVVILSNLLSTVLPNRDKILGYSEDANNTFNEYMEIFSSEDINSEETEKKLDELSKEISDLSYYSAKASVFNSIIGIVLYFLYFILFQSYNNGQTIGKKLLKIEVTSNDGKELSFKQMLIRGIILYPIVLNTISLILLFILNKDTYGNVISFVEMFKYGLLFACFVTLFSGRGLHDRIANTAVISEREEVEIEDGNATKWKKTTEKEKKVKSYNHTSGKRKG